MKLVGLMSGTSADGIDAALVEWPDGDAVQPFELIAFAQRDHPRELQERIHRLAAGRLAGPDALRELASLDVLIGERFAEAAMAVVQQAGVAASEVDGVASHGQTVGHFPETRATLQIGDPSVIAERTGWTTIADFRTRDMAAGGEGAPLAPFFHWAAFAKAGEARGVLNLGGIANLTWIGPSAKSEEVIAFDIGPANSLIDGVVSLLSDGQERMDLDGARAQRGEIDAALLEQLLNDDFLTRPAPKSTGRERYGLAQAEELVQASERDGRGGNDLVATLVAFSAEAVARACRELLPQARLDRMLVGGGGARNPALMSALSQRLPGLAIEAMDAHGVPSDAAEAMAFSLMGRNALLGIPNHLPRCTGAERAAVLGEVVPGRAAR